MPHPFTAPTYNEDAFNCPHCGAYAEQLWKGVGLRFLAVGPRGEPGSFFALGDDKAAFSECRHCGKYGIWVARELVFPPESPAPEAHAETPPEIADDFNEARGIVARSPRGACALLRLAVQKVCIHLGEPGKNLNDDIKALVQKGLSPQVQRSLDVLRVIGNNAVHPGELDLKDDRDTALALFRATNLVIEQTIAIPGEMNALYESLPQGARDAIEKRDAVGGQGDIRSPT